MKQILGILILLFSGISGFSQMLDIRIEPLEGMQSFTYQSLGDEVLVTTEDSFPEIIITLNTLEKLRVENRLGAVKLYSGDKVIGQFSSIVFWCNDQDPKFNMVLPDEITTRTYYDHLIVRSSGPSMNLTNRTYFDHYIRGVISAEAGHHKSLEFFKVQAVSARTYALNHRGRHGKEGFDLCDKTHCQVYNGVSKNNPLIEEAVDATSGEVIIQKDSLLIEAVFSANCGGYTANSEDVWVAPVEYLKATPDYGFCEGFPNHEWHVSIPKLEFLAKLGRYHKIEANSFEVTPDQSGRIKRIVVNNEFRYSISGEELRRLFKLKSAKFHIYDSNAYLFIEGEGFGHGVGMCQDGAYYLSEMGLDYNKILKHYYQNVSIIKIDELPHLWE